MYKIIIPLSLCVLLYDKYTRTELHHIDVTKKLFDRLSYHITEKMKYTENKNMENEMMPLVKELKKNVKTFNEQYDSEMEMDDSLYRKIMGKNFDENQFTNKENIDKIYIFTDGSSTHKYKRYYGGSGIVIINLKDRKIKMVAQQCKDCDSVSSEYSSIIYVLDNWKDIISNSTKEVILYSDCSSVIDNENKIFSVLSNIKPIDHNICDSKYLYHSYVHQKWCNEIIDIMYKYTNDDIQIISRKIKIKWIKAHSIHMGNIIADILSKWINIGFNI